MKRKANTIEIIEKKEVNEVEEVVKEEKEMKGEFEGVYLQGAGSFKKSKIEKVEKKKDDLVNEFGMMYAKALYESATNHSFNDDGGCYYEEMQTQVTKDGDWTRIYQPTRGLKEYEDGIYYYIFKYKQPITKEQFNSFKPIVKQINRLYLQSYNDVLKITGGKWNIEIEKGTFKEVAEIVRDLYLDDKGVIKISMTIRGYENWQYAEYWDPLRLRYWIEGVEYKEGDDRYQVSDRVQWRYSDYKCTAVPAKV